MVEHNVWRNYQTKLLGGGLLLIVIIIIAALLSHYNHAPIEKKEVELAIEPQANKIASASGPVNNQSSSLTTIEVARVDLRPNAAKPMVVTQPITSEPVQQVAPSIDTSASTPEQAVEFKSSQEINALPAAQATIPKPTPTKETIHPKAAPVKITAGSKATITNKAKPTAKKPPYTEVEKRLLATPKTHYTLQLVGANSSKNIQTFIKMHGLQNKASYYQTYNKGKAWYVIVYGDYKTKAEAQAALKKLPAAVQAHHPWPRDYASVHSAIQNKLS